MASRTFTVAVPQDPPRAPPQPRFPPIVVPPVPVRPGNRHAFVASGDVAATLEQYLIHGPPEAAKVDSMATDAENPVEAVMELLIRTVEARNSDNEIKQGGHQPEDNSIDRLMAHMFPLRQLRRGIPYHHLSLHAKLAMLEFLLDELLQVKDIALEFTRRHTATTAATAAPSFPSATHRYHGTTLPPHNYGPIVHTGASGNRIHQCDAIYGPVPQTREFEEM